MQVAKEKCSLYLRSGQWGYGFVTYATPVLVVQVQKV